MKQNLTFLGILMILVLSALVYLNFDMKEIEMQSNSNTSYSDGTLAVLETPEVRLENESYKQCLKNLELELGSKWNLENPLSFVLKDSIALYLRSAQLSGYQFGHYSPLLIKDASHLASRISYSGIAVFAITNGNMPNIQEWVVNNLLIGVEHIILTDDSKAPKNFNFLSALQPFVEIGFVSFYNPPLNSSLFGGGNSFIDRQTATYRLALDEFRGNFTWIAFFDTDEYLVLKEPMTNLSSILNNSEFAKAGSVYVFWKIILPWGVPEHNIFKTHFEQYPYAHLGEFNRVYGKSILHTQRCLDFDIHTCSKFVNGSAAGSVRDYPMELRHYYFNDLKFGLLEKICGQSEGIKKWYPVRVLMFKILTGLSVNSSYSGTAMGQTELRRVLYG